MEIIFTEKYGLANTIDKIIYLHPILNDFPELKEKVIKHELEHVRSKGFWENRKIDSLTEITFRDLFPVYKKKPSLLLKQYSPITYIDKVLYFEWSLIFLFLFYLGVIFFVYLFVYSFSPYPSKTFLNIIIFLGIITIFYALAKRFISEINKESKSLKKTKGRCNVRI